MEQGLCERRPGRRGRLPTLPTVPTDDLARLCISDFPSSSILPSRFRSSRISNTHTSALLRPFFARTRLARANLAHDDIFSATFFAVRHIIRNHLRGFRTIWKFYHASLPTLHLFLAIRMQIRIGALSPDNPPIDDIGESANRRTTSCVDPTRFLRCQS